MGGHKNKLDPVLLSYSILQHNSAGVSFFVVVVFIFLIVLFFILANN